MYQQIVASIRPWLCLKKGKVYLQHYPRPLYPPVEFGFRQFLLYPNNISIMTGGICTVLRAGRMRLQMYICFLCNLDPKLLYIS